MSEAHEWKRDSVLRALAARDAPALLLTSQSTLAWYLEGARVGVNRAGAPVLAVRVDPEGDRLIVYDNEADRIISEELPPGVGLSAERVPWFDPLAARHDDAAPEAALDDELRALRRRLFRHEIDAYRNLGSDTAAAMTDALAGTAANSTEHEVAAAIAHRVEAVGAEVLVLLVAGSARLSHRHPLPTTGTLGTRAMAVLCARRRGLVSNLTRWVGEEPTAAQRDLEERIALVEADAFSATRPGRSLAAVLADIADSYRAHGFDPKEWRHHHQGGPTGYAGRDPRASPTSSDVVTIDQAFAWNPSAPATKIEDTVLYTAGGIEVLTQDSRWPTRTIAGRARPKTLVR